MSLLKKSTVLQNDAKVTRPVVKGEIRLIGFNETISLEDAKWTIA